MKITLKEIISKFQILFIPCKINNERPIVLQSNFLPYFLIFLFLVKFIIVPFLIYFPATNFFADISKTILIDLTNNERKQLGLSALKENAQLNQAAFLKAQDILANNYFSHWSPQGKSPWHWFKKANYNYQAAGENLGIGFLDSSEVHQAWENSPTHKANLLSPNYQEIGIAVLQGNFEGNETTIVVQLFGTPKKQIKNQKPALYRNEVSGAGLKVKIEQERSLIEDVPIVTKIETETTTTQEIAGTTTEIKILSVVPVKTEEKTESKGLAFGIMKFLSADYSIVCQKIAFYALTFAFLALLLNILIHIKIQHFDLICKTIFCVFLLSLLSLVDKNFIIQMIPHNFRIY